MFRNCLFCISPCHKTSVGIYEPGHEKQIFFGNAKAKTQISGAVTAQLISAFIFTTWIVQYLFLNLKFQASSLLQAGQCRTEDCFSCVAGDKI